MNEIENNQHDQKIKELVGKVRQELGEQIIANPESKVDQYLSEIENLETVIPEENKKLWAELGIAEDTNQQKVVQEVQRLAELFATQNSQKINVYFATEKAPQEQLKDKPGVTEKKDDEFHIYLQLDRNAFPIVSESLVFWTLSQQLSAIGGGETAKNPDFWQHLEQQQLWVKENLTTEYQKQFTSLLTPSTFPYEVVDIKELYQVYFPNLEDIPNSQTSQTLVSPEIIDKTWQTIRQELIELTSQEVKKNPGEEKLAELAIKATITYNSPEYTIVVSYNPQNPLREQVERLILNAPLKLEIEYLKQKQAQLPTPENFNKLTKQKNSLENYLQDYMSEEDYQEIRKKIDQIK